MRIAFFNNQGGRLRLSFYAGIARELKRTEPRLEPVMVVWTREEAKAVADFGLSDVRIVDFESWVEGRGEAGDDDVQRLNTDYRDVNWSEVIAAERAFTDYSMLLGAAGHRREDSRYVNRLLCNIVGFLELVFRDNHVEIMACPTADTLFTLVGFKVARKHGITVLAESAAWLLDPEASGGGFFTADEFMHCPRMEVAYRDAKRRSLTSEDRTASRRMMDGILGFAGKTAFAAANKGASAGMQALTPNWRRLLSHLAENSRRNKDVDYTKFEPVQKLSANLRRLVRRWAIRRLLGSKDTAVIPPRSVFYALHYQPEQSTLAQGIWYANQVALVENISKALPLGYTLVVKEHPWGRGNRPAWQYRHMSHFHNVVFCDAPAKEIMRRVEAVVAVSGTVGMESVVLDRPTILLGQAFFDFSDLFYKVDNIIDLPQTLRRILIDRHYDARIDRPDEICRLLLAYRGALIPAFPTAENAAVYARAIIDELAFRKPNWPVVSSGMAETC